ncbi:MAG TPA: hypothetical protein VIV09_01630 [Pseudolabrys sp.]
MALPYAFSNNTTPTGPQLDADLQQLGEQSVRPCTAAGTNSITLALNANVSAITAYGNYQRFSAIAAATNTGAVQARVGSLALLNVYRDTPAGPVALVGGEIVIGCAFVLVYDSTLNTGAGGFHLISQANSFPWTGGTISNGSIVIANSTLSTLTITGASINAPTITGAVGSIGSLSGSIGSLVKLSVGATAASITRILSQVATIAYTGISAQTAQDQPMTLTGVQLGDSVSLGVTAMQTGAQFSASVPAASTVSVRCLNASAASISAFTLVARVTAHGFT